MRRGSSSYGSLPLEARAYLDELAGELREVPRARRREIVDDISAHIAGELRVDHERGPSLSAVTTAAGAPPVVVTDVLDRLGPPAEIARAARAELPTPRRTPTGRDIAAIVLLLVGGFLFLVGWVVGVVLLWSSTTWRLRDKVVATLLVPGGLATSAVLGAIGVGTTGAASCPTQVGGGPHLGTCAAQTTGGLPAAAGIVIVIVAVGGPIFTSTWLSIQARRHDRPMLGHAGH